MTEHEAGFFSLALQRSVVVRSLKYAVGVGTILILINHWDALVAGNVDSGRLAKMMLTAMVPYCVSTASSVGALRQQQSDSPR